MERIEEYHGLCTESILVSGALNDDLVNLCKAGDIPGYYHGFCESLTDDCPGGGGGDSEKDHNS